MTSLIPQKQNAFARLFSANARAEHAKAVEAELFKGQKALKSSVLLSAENAPTVDRLINALTMLKIGNLELMDAPITDEDVRLERERTKDLLIRMQTEEPAAYRKLLTNYERFGLPSDQRPTHEAESRSRRSNRNRDEEVESRRSGGTRRGRRDDEEDAPRSRRSGGTRRARVTNAMIETWEELIESYSQAAEDWEDAPKAARLYRKTARLYEDALDTADEGDDQEALAIAREAKQTGQMANDAADEWQEEEDAPRSRRSGGTRRGRRDDEEDAPRSRRSGGTRRGRRDDEETAEDGNDEEPAAG